MKNYLLITALLISAFGSMAQTKDHTYGISGGAFIQHYNGNLGNAFFKFRTTCFGGGSLSISRYLNKSFDVHISSTVGDFGYCQMDEDRNRIVSMELQCPGCGDMLGMGQLRSRMVAGNLGLTYKFANGYILKANSKLSPYMYTGMGVNRLSDNMGKQCVNVGTHITVNAGAGIKYNVTKRIHVGYNLALGCFMTKKVYNTKAESEGTYDADEIKIQKRKDLYLQNGLFLGVSI